MIGEIVTFKVAPGKIQQAREWAAKLLEYSEKKFPGWQISLLEPITGGAAKEMKLVMSEDQSTFVSGDDCWSGASLNCSDTCFMTFQKFNWLRLRLMNT